MEDKFDLMQEITNHFSSTYQATRWLKLENDMLDDTPANAMKGGRLEDTYRALAVEQEKKKN